MKTTTRYTIDLDKNFDNTLTMLAERKSVTKAEVIRRALATYSYISKQTLENPDYKLSITGNDDRVLKDIAIP